MTKLARLTHALAIVTTTIAASACLSVPAGTATDCTSDNDCDRSTGEVCDEGVCWGDPPAGAFAATLGAPSTRPDLVAAEIPQLTIPDDGYLGDLALDVPVELSGRVEMPDRTSVDATITISRPSRFPGGPGFQIVVPSNANVSGASFTAEVPRTRDGDAMYTITVVPNGRGATPADASADAQAAPPLYTTLAITDNVLAPTMTLGDPTLPTITGMVVDSNGVALPHYRVSAMGRWDPNANADTEVSTVSYTGADGTYSIVLAAGVLPGVKIVAKPYDTIAPTLQFAGFSATASSTHNLAQPVGLGLPISIVVPVEGVDGGGQVSPVVGARVTVIGAESTQQVTSTLTATLLADDTTDGSGNAHLTLIPGAALGSGYTLRIVPPASSNLGVVYNEPLTVTDSVTLPTHRLDPRIAIRGLVVDTSGNPVSNVAVTVAPSLKFLWSLAADPQAFVTAIPPPTTITPTTGDFVLWVDPIVDQVWGTYDLVLDPASGTNVPDWTVVGLDVPRQSGQADLALGNVIIPDPAFIHGRITDSAGNVVPGGQLRIFELQSNTDLCTTAVDAPTTNCAIPAIVRGSGTADGDGKTRLTLPRPD